MLYEVITRQFAGGPLEQPRIELIEVGTFQADFRLQAALEDALDRLLDCQP